MILSWVCRCALPHSQPSSKELQTVRGRILLSTFCCSGNFELLLFANKGALSLAAHH